MEPRKPSVGYGFLVCAAVIVVLAGIKAAGDIIIPFLVSIFLTILSGPAVFWLHRHRIPRAFAILMVVSAVTGCLTLVGSLAVNSLEDFSQQVPIYQARLEAMVGNATAEARELLEQLGLGVAVADFRSDFDLNYAVGFFGTTLRQFGSALTKTLLVFLTVMFMLLEAFRLPGKISAALGPSNAVWPGFREFADSAKDYLAIKTATSLGTGLCAGVWLWILGVDYAFVWGLLAFLLNYIPNIGSIIAATPPATLALVQFGLSRALILVLGYVAINVVIGSLIEPQFMGRGLGLSPLVVFVSLVFWGWLLGAVGMLLSTPLTMSVKIALENSAETRWISTLMGSGKT